MPAPGEDDATRRVLHTSTVRNTVALIPSAISYSPFSLGRVKLYSLPGPNILKDIRQQCQTAGFFTHEEHSLLHLILEDSIPCSHSIN